MGVIFDTLPGRIKTFYISGELRSFSFKYKGEPMIGILTNFSVVDEVAAQIAMALDGSVHVTPFGDKPSTFTVSFVLNPSCDTTDSAPLDQYMDQYSTQRLHPDNDLKPESITIGGVAYKSYIIGNSVQMTASSQSTIVGSLRFVGWRI